MRREGGVEREEEVSIMVLLTCIIYQEGNLSEVFHT